MRFCNTTSQLFFVSSHVPAQLQPKIVGFEGKK